MGRQSRKHREKRESKTQNAYNCPNCADLEQACRIMKLQDEINNLSDGKAMFRVAPDCPADAYESDMEDIRAFEAVGSGISLFIGLQMHGMNLPPPEQLDKIQSAQKVKEVLEALEDLRIFLVGFEGMTACELYSTLYSQTLWEGCYIKKHNPGAVTVIDVSHKMQRSEIMQFLDNLSKRCSIH
jgi:hypothetical protein